jgi:hypothetical protein
VLGLLRRRAVEQDSQQQRHDEEHPHVSDYAYPRFCARGYIWSLLTFGRHIWGRDTRPPSNG